MDTSNENQDKSQQGVPASGPGGDQIAQGSLEGTVSADGDPAETGNTIGLGTAAGNGGAGAAQGGAAAGEGGQQQSQQAQQSQPMEQSGQAQQSQPMEQVQQAGQSQQSLQSPAGRGQAAGRHTGVLRPPVDVIEDAQGITLLADMPGVAKENLNLRLESQSLTIEGALSLDGPQDMDSRYAEIRHQHYERTFALSRELDGEKATAELAHGVLRIRIPKTAHATPRKIPVNAGPT